MVTVTRKRYMPPWLPEHGYGNFLDERRLTDQQIAAIAKWVAEGALEGQSSAGVSEAPSQVVSSEPDLVLQALQSFHVPASGPDVYWNFIFKPNVDKTHWVESVDIRPGARQVVHHANLLVDRTGTSHLQESIPGAGFPGMDLEIMRNPFDPEGHFLFWKPGSVRRVEPEGFAWRLDPGNELVLNVHMHPSGKPEEVRPSLALYFTPKPQTHFPLLVQLENDRALHIPAGAADFEVSESFTLPMDVDVLAVYPHAHYLGKILEAYAVLPGGARTWLIRIPDWDPSWQAVYYYREPVSLPKRAVITMRYRYDNSGRNLRNPNHPPKKVTAGNQSFDEMAHLWLQVLPAGERDRRRELEQAVMEHRIEKNPNDFVARMNLGAVMLSRLNPQGAVSMLEAAVRISPARPEARNMLGLALAQTGRTREAALEFEAALQARPDYNSARFNLASVELRMGQREDAIENLRAIAAAEPDNQIVKERLAEALTARRN